MEFKKVYQDAIDDLQPSEEFMERLFKKEEVRSMKFNKRKAVVLAVVACMLLGTTALAAGKITTYRSWANPQKEITNYADANKKAKDLGCKVLLPQSFTNGYTFASANERGYEGLDENDNVVVSGTDFTANYVKENQPDIYLFVNQVHEDEEERYAVDTKVVGDVELYFNQAFYKFVPEDYELTEEDKVNMEKPNYEISRGADEVEEKNYVGVSFEKNGKYYNMFAWDSEMSAEGWYEMAEELLAAVVEE